MSSQSVFETRSPAVGDSNSLSKRVRAQNIVMLHREFYYSHSSSVVIFALRYISVVSDYQFGRLRQLCLGGEADHGSVSGNARCMQR